MSCWRGTALLLLLAAALPLSAGGKKDYTEIKLVVTDSEKGTPIPKAAVTLTFVRGKNLFGKKDRAQWDVKTDSRGNVTVPFIPHGKLKVVIFAKGYQTFGDEFEIAGEEQTIPVKLAVASGQFSVHEGQKVPEKKP